MPKRTTKTRKKVKKKADTLTPRLSITEVARQAKVSTATVSRVVNNRGTVKPELERRVRRTIEQTGYRPDLAARTLSSGRSRLLGVIISDLTNPFFPELLQNFEEIAVANGYEVIVASTSYDLQRMANCIDRMLERNVDGVAVMTFGMEEPLLERFAGKGVPLVFMDRAPKGANTHAIHVNYERGINEAVQHLAVLGHRHIGFVSGPAQQISVANRKEATKKALRNIGLSQGPGYIFDGDHTFESGEQALAAFMALKHPPTAVFCSNDLSAIGLMHAAVKRGIEIPKNLSVIGFDGIEIGAYMMPPLTSVAMSRRDIAKAAIDLLLGASEGHTGVRSLEPKVSTQLLVRRTTAVPQGSLDDLKPTRH